MGKIFCIIGKSATGKDTVYRRLLERFHDRFRKVVLYTTRPIRAGEQNGVEYYFVTIPQMEEMKAAQKASEAQDV